LRNRVNPSRSSVPECKTPWPRPIPAFSCFLLGYNIRCRTITRDSKTVRRATHALDGLSFIPPRIEECKGMLANFGAADPVWNLLSRSASVHLSRLAILNICISAIIPTELAAQYLPVTQPHSGARIQPASQAVVEWTREYKPRRAKEVSHTCAASCCT